MVNFKEDEQLKMLNHSDLKFSHTHRLTLNP